MLRVLVDQLKRLARRVSVGLGRVGAIEGDESGDIFLAFSTANAGADEGNSAVPPFNDPNATIQRMQSWKMDPMFSAVVTEGCCPVLMAYCSAGSPKASQPIGCRTLQPRIFW